MHGHETLSYAQLNPNSSKITLHNIILNLYAKDCKTKSKEFKFHHFQRQPYIIIFDPISYMLPTHPHVINHQTNAHFYQHNVIHKQIYHKTPY